MGQPGPFSVRLRFFNRLLAWMIHDPPATTPYAPTVAALNGSARAHRTDEVRLRAAEALRLALAGAGLATRLRGARNTLHCARCRTECHNAVVLTTARLPERSGA